MNENARNENSFIGYEYKDVTVSRYMASVVADGYENFGYLLEGTSFPIQRYGAITLKLKRDRKIRNKTELTRLQRQFDACVAEVETLERSKTIGASAAAYIIGVVGTAFMAGSVFAYLGGMVPLCIILAIPAFAGWVFPYLMFTSMHKKKNEKVTPLIDKKYDEIYEVCEKARSMI